MLASRPAPVHVPCCRAAAPAACASSAPASAAPRRAARRTPASLAAAAPHRAAAAALRAPSRRTPTLQPRTRAPAPPHATLDASLLATAAATSASADPVAIYAALGSSAAAFLATFFVAPVFKSNFKEAEPWERIYGSLVATGVPSLSPAEAAKRRGALLLDVRLADAVAKRALPKALSKPLYVPIQGWDAFSNIRRVAFAFFGIAGTELDPSWLSSVTAAIPNKGSEVVVVCEMGGRLENKPGVKFGFQSRSLKALYYLRQAGYKNVKHLRGGVAAWAADGLPLEGEE
jgi:rhodanese-related sulfurtransferase